MREGDACALDTLDAQLLDGGGSDTIDRAGSMVGVRGALRSGDHMYGDCDDIKVVVPNVGDSKLH